MGQPARGALLVVEGGDRTGKSTQAALLVDALCARGHPAEYKKFPDRTTVIGQMIDAYLKQTKDMDDHTIHLLFSANRWEAMKEFEALLSSGTTLVVDRYAYSGVAFSAAKGMDLEWCKSVDKGLIQPDAVIFLDLPPESARSRGGFGEERYETVPFQDKVNWIFQKLRDDRWHTVDASLPVSEVSQRVLRIALEAIHRAEAGDVREKLWL
ncbi:putative thymidylate kinase [Cladochytrium replicatum]|nr:putative thymidylate kinase [Cladochytrium replicatum]